MSVFGWGILTYKEGNDQIIFSFFNHPVTKYGFLYHGFVLNGFINKIYGDKFKIVDVQTTKNPIITKIYYKKFS